MRSKRPERAVIACVLGVLAYFGMYGRNAVFMAQNTNPNIVVATCGTPPANYPTAGGRAPDTVDTTGTKCAQSSAPVGGATSANQTNSSQKSQVCDGSANCVTVTGNKLDVNASAAAASDTVGTTVLFASSTGAASVAMSGQNGAEFCLAAGTLSATVSAEVSQDGGTTWTTTSFTDANGIFGGITVTNPNVAQCYSINFFGSITHARGHVTAYTSGSANGTARATGSRTTSQMMGVTSLGSGSLRPIVADTNGILQVGVNGVTITNNKLQVLATAQLNNSNDGLSVDYGAGNSTADTLRVVVATDQAAVSVKGTGNGTPVLVGFSTSTLAVNQTQWNGTAAAVAGYNGGNAVVVGFQTANVASNITQFNGTAAAVAGYNSGNAVVVGFQTSTLGVTVSGSISTGSSIATAQPVYMGGIESGNAFPIIACGQSAIISLASSGVTQVIALSATKKIYVCSWDIVAGGTSAVKLVYGTGTNCVTGTTNLTATYPFTAQTGLSRGSGLGSLFNTPASQALCVNNGSAVDIEATISYTQFGFPPFAILPFIWWHYRRRKCQ